MTRKEIAVFWFNKYFHLYFIYIFITANNR